jgi:hypothetical protein
MSSRRRNGEQLPSFNHTHRHFKNSFEETCGSDQNTQWSDYETEQNIADVVMNEIFEVLL